MAAIAQRNSYGLSDPEAWDEHHGNVVEQGESAML
jgi:hypothetical protein